MIRPLRIALASPWLVACGIPVDIGTLEGGTTAVSDSVSVSVSDSVSDSASESSTGVATSDSSTSVPPTETDTEDPPPPVQHDFAIRFGDLPDVGNGTDSGGSSASGTTGDLDIDLDTLVIRVTTGTASCADPFGADSDECETSTTYGFNLPPELQFVGATGRLEDHEGAVSLSGELDGECIGGGGTLAGNFEIAVIDGTRVAGRMFDIDTIDAPPSIDFDAQRCP